MAISFQVTFDCADPNRLAEFWAQMLEYQLQPPPPGFASWEEFAMKHNLPREDWDKMSAVVDPAGVGSRLLFQRVPEGKQAKNRVHLDVNVGGGRGTPLDERQQRVRTNAARLVGLGATQLREYNQLGEFWIVMADPEGNEFCLQ